MKKRKYLVTGAAGFIGSQLLFRLQQCPKCEAIGIDNFNDHLYQPELKVDRVTHFGLDVKVCDLRDEATLENILRSFEPTDIIHLAAHAGVRDSHGKEKQYHANNIDGTQNLIDLCKKHLPDVRIVYASTSCIYSGSEVPWTEGKETGKQLNPYGWTKWVNECQFQSSGLYNVGLRFFTVYGPWGRPDMALFDFTKKILDDKPITVYNYGDMKRDFTYIGDILQGVQIIVNNLFKITSGEVFNIGRGKQVGLMEYIEEIEKQIGKEAEKDLQPKHPADTLETWANTAKIEEYGYSPKVDVAEGVEQFYKWYKKYNGVD
jgi:UDP-glucuronate 4-epimerase